MAGPPQVSTKAELLGFFLREKAKEKSWITRRITRPETDNNSK